MSKEAECDYSRYRLDDDSQGLNTATSALQPKKTCKTIIEMSIED